MANGPPAATKCLVVRLLKLFLLLIAFRFVAQRRLQSVHSFAIRLSHLHNERRSCKQPALIFVPQANKESGRRCDLQRFSLHSSSSETSSPNSNDTLFQHILTPPATCRVNEMSVTDLAYVGDVVYELAIRCQAVWPSLRTTDLQNTVVNRVRAEKQADLLAALRRNNSSFVLTLSDQQVLSRGRNTANRRKSRQNPVAYQDATALEALIGYLYVAQPGRCAALLQWIQKTVVELSDA